MKWFDEYRASLKMIEVEEYLDLVFYRPLAFLLVKAIYPTSLTPNQLTVIALVCGVIGGVLFGFGSPFLLIIAAVLLVLYDVIDCSDGMLARLKKNGTRTGRILDGVADYIVLATVYVGIGIGFVRSTDDPALWWGLLIAAAASNTVHAILVDYYRNLFLDIVLQRKSTFEEDLDAFEEEVAEMKREGGHYFDRLIIGIYLRYSRLQRNLTSGQNEHAELPQTEPDEYYRRNRLILRLWLLLGPTTQLTFLIVCAFFNRMDIYIIGMISVANLWAIVLYLIQYRINLNALPAKSS
ncbi:MAG: hypothetical protein C0600_16545 [Ignavibacteria bacterium]|nr:MAG: hypothetical protein C0600_16545 [Ignavibacteria bacterium]